jgi:hypothetical protein
MDDATLGKRESLDDIEAEDGDSRSDSKSERSKNNTTAEK